VRPVRYPSLPPSWALPRPWPPALRELSPEHLDVFQATLGGKTLQAILDQSPLDDLKTVQELIQKRYVGA